MSLSDNDVEYIKRQYLCCAPISKFRFTESNDESGKQIDYAAQIKIFENTIGDSNSVKYPCRLSYRIAFLRNLIRKLEEDGEEVCDKFYEALTNFMMLNSDDETTHYRHFLLKLTEAQDRIIIKESKNLISEGTTGLFSWQAGFALAEWCNANRTKINNKVVLELGSGIGLTGLYVILTCSPKSYTFSDCHAKVLEMIVNNLQLNVDNNEKCHADLRTVEWSEESYRTNYRNCDVRVKYLLWSSINENDVDASWTNSSVVLASDVIYDETIFDELIEALRVLIKRLNALVIVATTVRNEETLAAFFTKLDSYELSYEDEDVPKPNLFLQFDETPVRILRIFHKV